MLRRHGGASLVPAADSAESSLSPPHRRNHTERGCQALSPLLVRHPHPRPLRHPGLATQRTSRRDSPSISQNRRLAYKFALRTALGMSGR